jgi:GT2 family glycosyltransferase
MPRYNVAIGMITGDHKVHVGVLASFIELANSGQTDFNFTPIFRNGIYIGKNRTFTAMAFITNTECDYLLFLDADNGITLEGLKFFMEDFEDPEVNIVTGKYMYKDEERKGGLMVVGYRPDPENEPWLHYSIPEVGFTQPLVNITQELGAAILGCGCLMIRRKVFEDLPYPWFRCMWEEGPNGGFIHVGEDIFFARLAEEHGFDIHLDQRIESPHYMGSKSVPPEWDMTKGGSPYMPRVLPILTKDSETITRD